MYLVELELLASDILKKLIASIVSLKDWSDECVTFGSPSLLHRDGFCRRKEREQAEVINTIRSDLRRRVKPILATLKAIYHKEVEQSMLLYGIN